MPDSLIICWLFVFSCILLTVLQANNNLNMAGMKLGLLRLSLENRLRELPPEVVNGDDGSCGRIEALRQELRDGAISPTTSYIRSRSSSLVKTNQYLTVAKPAALTGTLYIR